MLWDGSNLPCFVLWFLKICSYKQLSLTRQPRGASRVDESQTSETIAFKILLTLKMKAKKVFGKGRFRFGQIQGFRKIS